MTDLMFSTGFTPQDKKVCIRCQGVNDNPLQQLCDTCRKGDILADFFSGETCECYEHTGDNIECPKHGEAALANDFEHSHGLNDSLMSDIGDAKREAKFGVGL